MEGRVPPLAAQQESLAVRARVPPPAATVNGRDAALPHLTRRTAGVKEVVRAVKAREEVEVVR